MVSSREMRSYLPPLVKSVNFTREYPGFSYQYFKNFEEINSYFSELCGDDWMNQEWAKVWIGEHSKEKMRQKRNLSPRKITTKKFSRRNKFNKPIYLVRAVIRELNNEGLDQDSIQELLITRYGIELEK